MRALGQVGPPPVDRYTLPHAMLGYVFGVWGMPWYLALATTLAFEFMEDGIKRAAPGMFPDGRPDTWANSLVDSGAWMTGWAVGTAIQPDPAKIWKRK